MLSYMVILKHDYDHKAVQLEVYLEFKIFSKSFKQCILRCPEKSSSSYTIFLYFGNIYSIQLSFCLNKQFKSFFPSLLANK